MAWSAMAASIAVLLGGGVVVAAVAFVTTGLVDRVGRVVNRVGLPLIFQQIVGAALATGITVGLLWQALLPANTRSSLVVAATLTVLLSGLSVVGSVRDAIDGFFLTAAARAAEVAMFSAVLLTGVVLALKVGSTVGVELAVDDRLPPTGGSVTPRLLAAELAAGLAAGVLRAGRLRAADTDDADTSDTGGPSGTQPADTKSSRPTSSRPTSTARGPAGQ